MILRALRALAALSILAVPSLGLAHDFAYGDLRIQHPWARATTIDRSAGYMAIANSGATADVLLSAESEMAGRIELHMTKTEGGVAKMIPLERVEIPAKKTISFQPGGMHLMFMGLKRKLAAHEVVPVTLVFERAGRVGVQFVVQKSAAGGH
ncbi:MAG: copper chaperone PCu(A)C [Alphaproteobacteria bacterium]|nr:copper chaperone PCu(A)C [Alphaproteobacteria bacterium]